MTQQDIRGQLLEHLAEAKASLHGGDYVKLVIGLAAARDLVAEQTAADTARVSACSSCSKIEAQSTSFAGPHAVHPMPQAARAIIPEYPSTGGRLHERFRCGSCKTLYAYDTNYEYLAGGSEDEEYLTRLCIGEQIAVFAGRVASNPTLPWHLRDELDWLNKAAKYGDL